MHLKDKKILILGLGREGMSSFKFLRKKFPEKIIGVADQRNLDFKEKDTKTHFGKDYLRAIGEYDLIIKAPGINKDLVKPYLTDKIITSQTEIFLKQHKDKVIAVTGSKGKGITSDLIYRALKQSGKKTYLIGNMGRPPLDYYDKQGIFVFEISSHQLEDLKINPHIAIFLNIFPDHLDFFKTFKNYFKAKSNITLFQTKDDYFIFNSQYPELSQLARKTKARTIDYTKKHLREPKNSLLKGRLFSEDVKAAGCALDLFNISIEKTLKHYKPFEHRLEIVGTFKGIKFINDSASTLPEATIAALEAIDDVDTLILGGSNKGSDFKKLAREIEKKDIKTVILFPTEGEKILQELKKKPNYFFTNNMKEAVQLCYQKAKKVCLLSPACASFSCFNDYAERGKLFKKYVKELNET